MPPPADFYRARGNTQLGAEGQAALDKEQAAIVYIPFIGGSNLGVRYSAMSEPIR